MSMLKFNNLSNQKNLLHFVATRDEGNVSFSAAEYPEEALKSRKSIASKIEVDLNNWVVAGLSHGDNIALVTGKMRGRGAFSTEDVIKDCDAMITSLRNILLMIPVADCVPVLFYDPIEAVAAIAHAGWRGTFREISKKTVLKMRSEFGSDTSNVIIGIGPCICVKHYEVDEAVLPGAKGHLDLRAANIIQLLDAGVKRENIEVMDYCVYENTQLFFSHRAEGKTGRFATGILIK